MVVDQLRPLEASPTLDRLIAFLASYKPTIQALGKYVDLRGTENTVLIASFQKNAAVSSSQ